MSFLFDNKTKKEKTRQDSLRLDDAMMKRIDHLYESGNKRLKGAADWYEHTFFNIQNLMESYDDSGEDSDQLTYLFIDLLAATSPRCNIVRNTFLTSQIFAFINDGLLCKIKNKFEAHLNNICRALLGLPLSGQKVESFQANLLGDKNAVTVDTWMLKVFQYDHDNPSAKEYEDISAATHKVAKKYGVTPSQMQAALWVGVKAMEGDPSDTPEPFENTLARFKAHQDDQGQIDFAKSEDKYESIANSLAKKQEASNPPEPAFSSPTIYGPRLREIAIAEADLPGEYVDLMCEQPKGLLMAAILFTRENIEKWSDGKGDPVEELQAMIDEENEV